MRASLRSVVPLRHATLALALATAALVAVSPAAAQPSKPKPGAGATSGAGAGTGAGAGAAEATERARVHFNAGVKLYDQKPPDYEGALAEFRAAYAEKATPTIQANIALCLRGLHRYGDAIDELEQMLATGGDTMKPETRAAARRSIDEMSAQVATVRLRVIVHVVSGGGGPPPSVDLALDGFAVPSDLIGKTMHLEPGEHTFIAHAPGYADAIKRVRLAAGQRDTSIDLDLQPASGGGGGGAGVVLGPGGGAGAGAGATTGGTGRVHVLATAPTATIALDGVPIGAGDWTGDVRAGMHHVEVTSPGKVAYGTDVNVLPGAVLEIRADMGQPLTGEEPPPVEGPEPQAGPPKKRLWDIEFGFGVQGGPRTQTKAMDELGDATKRGYTGPSLVVKAGRRVGLVLIEVFGEIGVLKSSNYASAGLTTGTPPSGTTSSGTTFAGNAQGAITYEELGPELRVITPGRVLRFVGGFGFGVHAEQVRVTRSLSGLGELTGSGGEGMALLEAGAQLSVSSRVFFELGAFGVVHGVGQIKDGGSKARYYLESPATRAGGRLLMGIGF